MLSSSYPSSLWRVAGHPKPRLWPRLGSAPGVHRMDAVVRLAQGKSCSPAQTGPSDNRELPVWWSALSFGHSLPNGVILRPSAMPPS